ncbi:alpha/beta hydrolase [Ancylobacter sp. Lp-2]|uniref:alpha/beta fold hydrolase n=1 Tax=Ancylobacter sp. Lp-2 TaxID=2881339 RepID=UPI001E2D2518|nr:alpha/beta hydrolase [Ancylobacter sp. Lp-2]MCB4768699.1 alpha/beta hydrolase [Ancylobacter sp. Lp-2]
MDRGALAYREAEGGDPPILLVHGWCCDHTFLAPQLAHFAGLGHRVLSVDLRGHGASDKPESGYAIADFADDLAELCDRMQVAPCVVIGHSMGGIVAYDLAVRYPQRVAACVMIDASVTSTPARRAAFDGVLAALDGSDPVGAMRGIVETALLIPTDDPARRASILERMGATPPHVMRAAYAGLRDFDPEEGGRRLTKPALYIAADEPVARTDISGLVALVPHLMLGRTVGSGHFCQLEVPVQVNAMIDRFLAVTAIQAAP